MKLFGKKKSDHQLPEGWSETKIDDTHFITHIPEEQIEKWNYERRKKDKVEKLINENGFHLKSQGRSGMVYYVDNGKMCEIYFEISGVPDYDLLFWYDAMDSWFHPASRKMAREDKQKIKLKFKDWLKSKRIRGDL